GIEIIGLACLENLKWQVERPCGALDALHNERLGRAATRVFEDGHPANIGENFLEQLQLLAEDLRVNTVCEPCDVSARAREPRHESNCHRFSETHPNDWNRPRGIPGRQR